MPLTHNQEDRIETLVGLEAIETCRPLWDGWVSHPNADLDFFMTVIASRPSVVDAVALVLYRGDIPIAMAVGRLERVHVPISIGYWKLFKAPVLQYHIVYGGLLGDWDSIGAEMLMRHLQEWMRRDRIDAIYVAAIPKEHPVYIAAGCSFPRYIRGALVKENPHWRASISTVDVSFQHKINSKHRSQFRNKERKLAHLFGGDIRMESFQRPEDVVRFCTIAETVCLGTYLRGLGEGFYDNQEMRNRLALTARKGWLRGYVLYAHNQPCAFWLGTFYQHIFHLDYTAFNPNLDHFSPGRILFVKMIDELREANELRGIDFGFGDAEYKKRFGDTRLLESDLYLFAATPTMILSNLARKTIGFARDSTEAMLRHTDLIAKVKRRWRRTAQKSLPGKTVAVEPLQATELEEVAP